LSEAPLSNQIIIYRPSEEIDYTTVMQIQREGSSFSVTQDFLRSLNDTSKPSHSLLSYSSFYLAFHIKWDVLLQKLCCSPVHMAKYDGLAVVVTSAAGPRNSCDDFFSFSLCLSIQPKGRQPGPDVFS